jgi:thiamine biosynthesis lipoprotein
MARFRAALRPAGTRNPGPLLLGGDAMRTRFELALFDDRELGTLRAAAEEALAEVRRVETMLSAFRHDSLLHELNARAADAPVRTDPELIALLARAGALTARLDGAFDPTVGALTALLRRGTRTAQAWEQARAGVGFARVVRLDIEASTASLANHAACLDLGAIGKGYALERVLAVLAEAGIERALVHGGTSSVCALEPPGGAGLAVAVAHPRRTKAPLAWAHVGRQSLSVSVASGARAGTGTSPTVDPRTGRAVRSTLQAAALADDPVQAEALSTALVVLGTDGLDLVRQRFPGASALVAARPPRGATGALRVELQGPGFSLQPP